VKLAVNTCSYCPQALMTTGAFKFSGKPWYLFAGSALARLGLASSYGSIAVFEASTIPCGRLPNHDSYGGSHMIDFAGGSDEYGGQVSGLENVAKEIVRHERHPLILPPLVT
jgi:hypothetical protein